jgi:hypothetical protein
MIVKLYRKYISEKTRNSIYDAFLGSVLFFLRNFSQSMKFFAFYLFRLFLTDNEKNQLRIFMGKHGIMDFPYEFALKYRKFPINCFYDEPQKMYYVIHHDKKLYFPLNYKERDAIKVYRNLIIEQDILSPHRYIENPNRLTGKTIMDIGSAEGIFSLDAIDVANHIYLFECEDIWLKPLQLTFMPWKEKITIVPKYVSDINDEKHITIDHFLEGKDKSNLFLKMDIEGCEQAALRGAINTLRESKDIDYAICTYHYKNDAKEIEKIFIDNHFESEFTNGFFYLEKDFRKAIIRRNLFAAVK